MCRLNWVEALSSVDCWVAAWVLGYCRWVLGNWASPWTVRFCALGIAGWIGRQEIVGAVVKLGCRRLVGLAIIIGS